MSHAFDSKALELSRQAITLFFEQIPGVQLQAQIQNLFIEAMEFAAPAVQAEQLSGNTEQVEPVSAANKLGGWIPVSERLPENKPGSFEYIVFENMNNRVNHDYWNVPDIGDDAFTPFWNHYGGHVTHWMPLPAAPKQEAE